MPMLNNNIANLGVIITAFSLIACSEPSQTSEPEESMPNIVTAETTELTIIPIIKTSIATLISGPTSSMLIDTQLTVDEGNALIQKIRETGKPLDAIYITHAHIDHGFNLDILSSAFPNARLLAAPEVGESLNLQYAAWKQNFGEDSEDSLLRPEFVFEDVGDSIDIDGVQLQVLYPLQGDDQFNTAVWIPSESTLITGDMLSNQVHLFFVEQPDRSAWLDALNRLEELDAQTIIPGHTLPELALDGVAYEFTREYINLFDELILSGASADEVIETITTKYPDADPGSLFILERSAVAVAVAEP